MQEIKVKKLYDVLLNDSKAVLIDVRTPEEWEQGIADIGEKNVYTNMVVTKPDMIINDTFILDLLHDISKKSKVYFICRSGQRSHIAGLIADIAGYKSIYNVTGGMIEWVKNDLPIKNIELTDV